jgi:TP901 family phage tail tape measure protein
LGNELGLGIGIVFDNSTLQQLNAILNYVKKIQSQFDSMGNPTKKTQQDVAVLNAKFQELGLAAGKVVKEVENVGKSITKSYDVGKGKIAQVTHDMDGQIGKIKLINNAFQNITETIGKNISKVLEWGLSTGVVYGAVRVLGEAFKTLTDFDVNRVNILKVLDPKTDFRPFAQGAQIISQQYGVAITDTMKAMQAWSRQIKDTNSIIELTNASMLVASVTDITLESSYKALSATMAQFNMQVSDSNHVISAWNELSNHMRTSAEDLAQGIAKTGAAAKLMGVTFDETNAIIGTMVEVLGTSGSQAGTVLNRMFSRIHTEGAINSLKKVNIDAMQPMTKTLDQVGYKWNQYSKSEQEAIAKSLGGMHHWQKIMAVFSNWNRVIEATMMSFDSYNSAQNEAELALSTYNKKIEQLNATWQSFIVKIGNGVLPILKNIVDGFKAIISFGDGVLVKIGLLVGAFYGLKAVWVALFAAGTIATGGWVAIITAAVLAITALVGWLSQGTNKIQQFNDTIQKSNQEISRLKQSSEQVNFLQSSYVNLTDKLSKLDKKTKEYSDTLKLHDKVIKQIDDLAKEYGVKANPRLTKYEQEMDKIDQLIKKIHDLQIARLKDKNDAIDDNIKSINKQLDANNEIIKLFKDYKKLSPADVFGRLKKGFEIELKLASNPNLSPLEQVWKTLKGVSQSNLDDLLKENEILRDQRKGLRVEKAGNDLSMLQTRLSEEEEDWGDPDTTTETLADKIKKIKDTLNNNLQAIDNQEKAYKRLGYSYDAVKEKIEAYNNASAQLSRIAPNDNALVQWAKELAKLNPQEIMNQLSAKMRGIQEQFEASGNKAQMYKEQINALETAIKALASANPNSPFLENLKDQLQDIIRIANARGGLASGGTNVTQATPKNNYKYTVSAIEAVSSALGQLGNVAADVASGILGTVAKSFKGGKFDKASFDENMGQDIWAIIINVLMTLLTQPPKKQRYKEEQYDVYKAYTGRMAQDSRLQEISRLQNKYNNLSTENQNLLIGQSIQGQIKDIEAKIKESMDNWLSAIGASINDVATQINNAFEAANYMDFLTSWNQNLYEMTRTALIRGFMAQSAYQDLYKNLSQTIGLAVLDGTLTAEEMLAIRDAGNAVSAQMGVLYQALNALNLGFPGMGESGSQNQSFTAGSSVPLTINNFVNIYGTYFGEDEDGLRSFAIVVANEISKEQSRA